MADRVGANWGGAAALWALLLPLPAGPVAAAVDCPGSGTETGTVVEALAGDLLRLADGVLVRLSAVEAPPRPLALADDSLWRVGDESRKALAALAVGLTVRLAWTSDGTDRHGRRHARVVLTDGRWLESVLVDEGSVRARWVPGEDDCYAELLLREKAARARADGLWADPGFAALSADDPSLRSRNGLYELVEGRVVSVGHGSRMIFLDFGPNVRHDFTIMVPTGVAEAMTAGGLDPDGLAGRRVRVRGIVEESGGPAIRINHPAEIELID